MDLAEQMAVIEVATEAKEEKWLSMLDTRMARRARIMRMLAFRQYRDCEAYTLLKIRKDEAEADR